MPQFQGVDKIWSSLLEQVKTGHLCDVLFYCDSGSVWAHSCILEGFSPFFSQLFSNSLENGHHWSIKQPLQISITSITNCKSQSNNNCMHCIAQVVRFVYTGNLTPSLVHLHHLFMLCDRLENKELLAICERFQQDHTLLTVPTNCALEGKTSETQFIVSSSKTSVTQAIVSNSKTSVTQAIVSSSSCSENTSDNPHSTKHQVSRVPEIVGSESHGDLSNSLSKPSEELECHSESGNLLVCKLCSFVSSDQDMIRKHSKAFHHSVYKCVYCNFSHKNVAMLVDHIETQCASNENIICSVCFFKGQDSTDLVTHIKTHLSPKPFTCTNCERGFDRRSLWLKHLRSHLIKKSLVCTSCSLRFDTDAQRNKHYMITHAPKKHVCSECGFSAPFISVLESHQLRHRKLKLSCKREGCNFQTSSEIMLLRHNSVHKSSLVEKIEKLKECSVCSMRFTLTKNLVRHMKTHNSGHQKLRCQFCSYETFRTDKYNEHLSNKHYGQRQKPSNKDSAESPTKQVMCDQRTIKPQPACADKSANDSSSIKHLRDGYNMDSPFSEKHNTLMMNDEGDISIVNSNEKNSVTLRNIGNLTGTITLDERTGILTMNNINSGSVFLNETTGELTYINLENDNYFNQESMKQVDNFKTPRIPNSNSEEVTKLDEFTGEIVKVSTSNEENWMPEQEFDSFDMDVNDESLDGFDDFDEMLFDVFNEEDQCLGSHVVLQNEPAISIRPSPMPHLDESTGLLTFDETLVRPPDSQEWGSYQPIENCEINNREAYQLLLDEVTGVLHD